MASTTNTAKATPLTAVTAEEVPGNVAIAVVDGKIVITIDASKRLGPSKSGKTTTVATTNGFRQVGLADGSVVSIGVNAFVK
jgi:hypothetical protein